MRRGEAVAAPPCPAEPRASCRVRSCCSTTSCRASCRSGSKGWRRTARAWTSALVRPAAAGAPAWPRAFGARSLSGPQLARLLGGACKRTCSAVSAGTVGSRWGRALVPGAQWQLRGLLPPAQFPEWRYHSNTHAPAVATVSVHTGHWGGRGQ